MEREDVLDLAEAHIQRGERAGMTYPTPEQRADAKLRLAEQFKKEARQENIGPAAAANEGLGTPISAGAKDHAAIAEEIEAERRRPATAASMARRKKLRADLDDAIGDVQVTFTRG